MPPLRAAPAPAAPVLAAALAACDVRSALFETRLVTPARLVFASFGPQSSTLAIDCRAEPGERHPESRARPTAPPTSRLRRSAHVQPERSTYPPTHHLDQTYSIAYTDAMKTLSSTALRANLSAVMDQVNDDHEPVIVTRAKGKPVVMVSLEDWASMDETTYLLSSPENARRLRESIRRLNEGKGAVRELIEE
jgi:antitoxin YefM